MWYSDLKNTRKLVMNFAIMDFKIRYKNSGLGFLWSFLEPLLYLGVLYVVFTNIFKNDIPDFPLFLLLGLILYNMFQKGTDLGTSSITSKGHWFTQMYISRQIPAISASVTVAMMLILELVVFAGFMVIFQFTPTLTILYLPLILVLEFILIIGLCLPLSVLNVKYKDTQFIWKVVLQAGFFLTPIFYQTSILPQIAQDVLKYSPMVHILNMARDVTLYDTIPSHEEVFLGIGSTLVVFVIGYAIFHKYKKRITEEL